MITISTPIEQLVLHVIHPSSYVPEQKKSIEGLDCTHMSPIVRFPLYTLRGGLLIMALALYRMLDLLHVFGHAVSILVASMADCRKKRAATPILLTLLLLTLLLLTAASGIYAQTEPTAEVLESVSAASLKLGAIAAAKNEGKNESAKNESAEVPQKESADAARIRFLESQIRILQAQNLALVQELNRRSSGSSLLQPIGFPGFQKAEAAGNPAGATIGAQGKASPPEKEKPAEPKTPAPGPYQINGQATFILQNTFKFRSPYEGTNSFKSRTEQELSQTYTLYLGARLSNRLEVYIDPEMARGHGLSNALGIAGYTNGEVIRNPTLSQDPYLGRYFARWNIATGHGEEKVDAAQNQVATTRPTHRLTISAGKLAVNDIFDLNSYANSTRTQFQNWALLNGGAYDYAADTRGYSRGLAVEWINPDFALRLGTFQMPVVANGIDLAGNITASRGDQVELELHPKILRHRPPAIVRLLGFRNLGHMGNYAQSVALGQRTGTTPDITKTETRGNIKTGFVLNGELPVGDEGDTGFFGRYSYNDGATEDFAYTEVDRGLSLGFQISGKRWKRARDRFALALVQNDLSGHHKDYLAAGGLGFIIGDGKLNYAPEQILETYYNYQLNKFTTFGIDYQYINNPGYNADRGPVSVLSGRLHFEF